MDDTLYTHIFVDGAGNEIGLDSGIEYYVTQTSVHLFDTGEPGVSGEYIFKHYVAPRGTVS